MKLASFDEIVRVPQRRWRALHRGRGTAVSARGYLPFTKDVDLVVRTPDLIDIEKLREIERLKTREHRQTAAIVRRRLEFRHLCGSRARTTTREAACLDSARWLTTMADMKATAREFTREFPRFRRAARAGQTVHVRDRDGVTYVFTRETADAPSLAEVAGHLLGSVNSGVTRKSLKGYGKNPGHR